jgi:hypothetical protein
MSRAVSADYAAMSDPLLNPQFRRGWCWEWPPGKRKGRLSGPASVAYCVVNSGEPEYELLERQAQALARRWGLAYA